MHKNVVIPLVIGPVIYSLLIGLQSISKEYITQTNYYSEPMEVQTLIYYLHCDCRYDWYQTDCAVTINVYTRHSGLRHSDVIIELSPSTIESSSPQMLHICVLINDHTFHVQRGQDFVIWIHSEQVSDPVKKSTQLTNLKPYSESMKPV